ncbi:MAG: hypothetical protein AAGA30_06775, partial [Planctomycetota bacterium]
VDVFINVRRGILKYFRSYFSHGKSIAKTQMEVLNASLEDPDLDCRYQSAATLTAWGKTSRQTLNVMLDSLQLNNYRAATTHALMISKETRPIIIQGVVERISESEDHAEDYITLLSYLTPESNSLLEKILGLFGSEKVQVRMAVVEAIGRMSGNREKCLAVLQEAAIDPSHRVRRLVLPALVTLEPDLELFKSVIVALVKDQDPNVAEIGASGIGMFGDQFDQFIPDLQQLINEDDQEALNAVLSGLTKAGPLAKEATPLIFQILSHVNYDLQIRAGWALLSICDDDEKFISTLNDELDKKQPPQVYGSFFETLSQLLPTDERSKSRFVEGLDNENELIRYASVYGLQKLINPQLVEKLLLVKNPEVGSRRRSLTKIDKVIIDAISKGNDQAIKKATKYLSHDDPIVRTRAIEGVTNSELLSADAAWQNSIRGRMNDSDPLVQMAVAKAISKFPQVSQAELAHIFNLANPNNRQRTVNILNLLGTMGKKAEPITPKIADLMNDGFRKRFANDAQRVLSMLGLDAAPALYELDAPFSIQKLLSITAIGQLDEDLSRSLKEYIGDVNEIIENNRNQNTALTFRRARLYALSAYTVTSGDTALITPVIREELATPERLMALTTIKILRDKGSLFVDDVAALLPDPDAIKTLAEIGTNAKSAVAELESIANDKSSSNWILAKKAIWQISDSPELAVELVNEVFRDNRFQVEDLKTEHRLVTWETLRFLVENHSDNRSVQSLLKMIERCRFQNLRAFAANLMD